MMKTRFVLRLAVMLVSVWALSGASCHQMPEPEPEPEPVTGVWFDLFVSAGAHFGMNPTATYVRSVASLEADQPVIEFTGKAIDITNRFTIESITRGRYYYQVPLEDSNRFVKFHIEHNEAGEEYLLRKVDEEIPFKNVYYPRKFLHGWRGKYLFMLSVDFDNQEYYWTRRRGDNLAISREGRAKFNLPAGYGVSEPGLLTITPTNHNRIYYFYSVIDSSGKSRPTLHYGEFNNVNMKMLWENVVQSRLMEELAADGYTELLGNTIAYDESGNLYLAGLANEGGLQVSVLRRIVTTQATDNYGHPVFDSGWNGFLDPEGKLLTIQYVGNDKMLLYSRNDRLGKEIDSRSHFYSILDLKTGKRERLSCNGVPLPYCTGGLSRRSDVLDGKAYIGVTGGDGPDDCPMIYIYDSATGDVVPGARLEKGYYFDLIRVMKYEEIPLSDDED